MARLCSSLLLLLLIASSAAATTIILGGGVVTAEAGPDLVHEEHNNLFVPSGGGMIAFASASESSSHTQYTLADEGGFTFIGFHFQFDHFRDLVPGAVAASGAHISFSVTTDIDYVISGHYSAEDSDGRLTALKVSLLEAPSLSVLYSADHVSHVTPNESFVLGEPGGDDTDEEVGSPAHSLRVTSTSSPLRAELKPLHLPAHPRTASGP